MWLVNVVSKMSAQRLWRVDVESYMSAQRMHTFVCVTYIANTFLSQCETFICTGMSYNDGL